MVDEFRDGDFGVGAESNDFRLKSRVGFNAFLFLFSFFFTGFRFISCTNILFSIIIINYTENREPIEFMFL